MEKTLTIDGKQVRFKSTGATALRYKAQFQSDYLVDIIKLLQLQKVVFYLNNSESNRSQDFDGVDFETVYNITWVLAKTADPSIPDPIAWLDQFEEFPLDYIIGELTELITSSIQSKKK